MSANHLPVELVDLILVHAAASCTSTPRGTPVDPVVTPTPYGLLRSCALVSSVWRAAAQPRLFSFVLLDSFERQDPLLRRTFAEREDLAHSVKTVRLEAWDMRSVAGLAWMLRRCTGLTTLVWDGPWLELSILHSHLERSTLAKLRVVFEPEDDWTICAPPFLQLPTSLHDISIPALALAEFVDGNPEERGDGPFPPPLSWLSEKTRYLTLSGSLDESDWGSLFHLSTGHASLPSEGLFGINASIGCKFAVEQVFPPGAPAVKFRLPIIWHVAWQAFVDYMPPWRDFASPPNSLAQPHAHHITALYILPLPYSPVPPHFLDELKSRVGLGGDPSLEQLDTVFLDEQWRALFGGPAALPGRDGRPVEIVFVGSVLSEEEELIGGGVGKEDVGFPAEMKRWVAKRRQEIRAT